MATKAEEEKITNDSELTILTAAAIMSLEPKKTGGPIQKFWDSPEIVTSLESVKGWLSKNAKKVRCGVISHVNNQGWGSSSNDYHSQVHQSSYMGGPGTRYRSSVQYKLFLITNCFFSCWGYETCWRQTSEILLSRNFNRQN